jgi:hypothetical protein
MIHAYEYSDVVRRHWLAHGLDMVLLDVPLE